MPTSLLECTDPISSYQEALARLDQIVEACYHLESRVGYFAALYRHIVRKFQICYDQGIYATPTLIASLHITFVNRYLAALHQHALGTPASQPWQVAFDAAASPRPTVMQHLLLGMAAHILYDLPIALVETCSTAQLSQIQGDFELMNDVLCDLIGDLDHDIGAIWPALAAINAIGHSIGAAEASLMSALVQGARADAWSIATRLSLMGQQQRATQIASRARRVAFQAALIANPPPPLGLMARIVRSSEPESVRQTIAFLVHRRRVSDTGALALREQPRPRTRLAVLGGGVGALTAVFALTDADNPRCQEYDITVYQLGWRLGGKGASGRNPAANYRIEEHGLHLWFGCYDNAFRVIRKCYADLNRPPDAALATWRDAFKPHSVLNIGEEHGQRWSNWLGIHYNNSLLPGDDVPVAPPWSFIVMTIRLMHGLFTNSSITRLSPTGEDVLPQPDQLGQLLDALGGNLAAGTISAGARLLELAQRAAELPALGNDLAEPLVQQHLQGLLRWAASAAGQLAELHAETLHSISQRAILATLDLFMRWLWSQIKSTVDSDVEHRHVWIFLNFAYGNLRGALQEDIFRRGVDHLNEYDYREWLAKYVFADGQITINSSMMLAIYDSMFAYVDGDNTTPAGAPFPPNARMEAGTALRCGIRQFLLYKGSAVWKMQAGMGDTVFAPLYQVLKRRGVKFEFFHRVRHVQPSADRRTVERVVITRQAALTPEQQARSGGYDPLIDVKGLPCWPSAPCYDQLANGQQLREQQVDFESYASAEHDLPGELNLTAGKDFDKLLLGISLGALPYVCADLIRHSPRWQAMVDRIKTIRTMGLQIWAKPTAFELGWTVMGRPMSTGYEVDPLDTWADMSHLIEREGWTTEQYPQFLAYFCGAIPDQPALERTPSGPRVGDVHDLDQAQANQNVRDRAVRLMHEYVTAVLPNAAEATGDGTPRFRWDVLVDYHAGAPRDGESRFDSQYWRANTQPSERYVLSVPGSSRYRLPAHSPDEYANMYLAGDWTDNGFNVGCVEAATMSGLLAAHAISGYPRREQIFGLDLLRPNSRPHRPPQSQRAPFASARQRGRARKR